MATIYYTENSSINPETEIDEYVESDLSLEEAKLRVITLNNLLTDTEIANNKKYFFSENNYSRKEWYS